MSQVLEVPYPGGPVPLRAIRSAQRGGLGTRECAGEVGVGARVGATKKLPRYRATYLRWPSCPPARPPAPGRSSTRLWPARIPYQRYEYLRCAARHPSALRRRSPPPPLNRPTIKRLHPTPRQTGPNHPHTPPHHRNHSFLLLSFSRPLSVSPPPTRPSIPSPDDEHRSPSRLSFLLLSPPTTSTCPPRPPLVSSRPVCRRARFAVRPLVPRNGHDEFPGRQRCVPRGHAGADPAGASRGRDAQGPHQAQEG